MILLKPRNKYVITPPGEVFSTLHLPSNDTEDDMADKSNNAQSNQYYTNQLVLGFFTENSRKKTYR